MILLPLGPKGKLPDLPLMTIAIGLCTIAFSIFSFRSLDQAITHTMKHEGYRVSKNLSEDFTTKWCETEAIKIADCNRLKSHLTAFNLLSKKDFLIAVESKTSAQKIPKLAEFSDQLFTKLYAAPEWQLWKSHVHSTYSNGYWLTSKSISFMSVMKAQFTHGGWIHLLSNMIFFFAFAGALEMRLGIGAWLALYLVGGASGLILHAASQLPEGVPLIGASAGISALAGAYLTFFWKHSTRVLFSVFVYSKVILIPTFAFVLIMLVSQDIAGSLGAIGTTAHIAHLSGLVFGAVFAVIHRFLVTNDLAFLYPQEADLFEEAQDSKEALAIYDQILVWNPENMIVRDLAFAEVVKEHVPQAARIAFYKFHLEETCSQLRRDKDYDRLTRLARDVAFSDEPEKTVALLDQTQCISLIRILSLLDLQDVFEKWVTLTAQAHPKVKTNHQYRIFAAKVKKKDESGVLSA